MNRASEGKTSKTSIIITSEDIRNAIKTGKSSAGGINNMGYAQLKELIRSKESEMLTTAMSGLANTLLTKSVPNLNGFLSGRVIPLKKKDGNPRPITIGDILRRTIMKTIHWKAKQLTNLKSQFGNGIKMGAERVITYFKRKLQDNSKEYLLTVDASNAFGALKVRKIIDGCKVRAPWLMSLVQNLFSVPMSLKINKKTYQIAQSLIQGCPMSGLLFCIGMDNLIQRINEVVEESDNKWFFDDGYVLGNYEEITNVWEILKTDGKEAGFIVNHKSAILTLGQDKRKIADIEEKRME